MKIHPPIIRSQIPFWECLEQPEKDYLRSFCSRKWKPPEFHFVKFNFRISHLFENQADYEHERELNKAMTAVPKDRYAQAVGKLVK